MTTTKATGKEWEQWMHGMGRYTRRLREFVGLSQEQLARVAGVSQGAVGRLEMGRAINAPLVVVLKINRAMRDALGRLDPKLLSREAREVMAIPARGIPGNEAGFDRLPVGVDPELTELARMFRRAVTEPSADGGLTGARIGVGIDPNDSHPGGPSWWPYPRNSSICSRSVRSPISRRSGAMACRT
jgi:transcriptional regulator with XRE-family HTH domain